MMMVVIMTGGFDMGSELVVGERVCNLVIRAKLSEISVVRRLIEALGSRMRRFGVEIWSNRRVG
jgi:hypothetical protein